ncbi:MAG: hypothetical protein HC881_16445 [Leptolyngbyaceae cyanobacterium SL_7_1]|nr:hypothetical protein [Leptolyngbyaceae cyanobacterium SL_7_1]
MNQNVRALGRVILLASGCLLALGFTVGSQSFLTAHTIQAMPQIEVIGEPTDAAASYRLTITQPEDVVFVSCPENYAPTLSYLRNVEAIRCEPFQ